MLNELSSDLRLEIQQQKKPAAKVMTTLGMNKLKGLLTFGSPLDKIFYFFRAGVSDEQAVRLQILSHLYSSRKQKSRRDYSHYKFEPYDSYFQHLYWVNLYSHADVISGYLDFYTVDKQCALHFWNPLTAHGQYWQSLAFYEWVYAWLMNARDFQVTPSNDNNSSSQEENDVHQKTLAVV
ncbi:MAG: hypothetical protein ACRCYY_20765 [Trueperaceae bacterium]